MGTICLLPMEALLFFRSLHHTTLCDLLTIGTIVSKPLQPFNSTSCVTKKLDITGELRNFKHFDSHIPSLKLYIGVTEGPWKLVNCVLRCCLMLQPRFTLSPQRNIRRVLKVFQLNFIMKDFFTTIEKTLQLFSNTPTPGQCILTVNTEM